MDDRNLQKKLAVLIDAENASYRIIGGLLEEIANYGIASTKRIYGDWTTPNMQGWKKELVEHSIQPIQQFSYTTGKNASDSALIIDAMDLLYTGNYDGFCIVSSDSDFTRIASRIREDGLTVYGFGETKTPKSFVGACDKFIFTEILRADYNKKSKNVYNIPKIQNDTKLIKKLTNAVIDAQSDDGWSHLGRVGQIIANKSPEFDPRNYGYKKLGELIIATKLFKIDERMSSNSPAKAIYIKLKNEKRYK